MTDTRTTTERERQAEAEERRDRDQRIEAREQRDRGQRAEGMPRAATEQAPSSPPQRVERTAGSTRLFDNDARNHLQTRWKDVQSAFVDDPRNAVETADELVADVVKQLTDGFAKERRGLEEHWSRGDYVSTEDLRIALQRYRSFFDRLLEA